MSSLATHRLKEPAQSIAAVGPDHFISKIQQLCSMPGGRISSTSPSPAKIPAAARCGCNSLQICRNNSVIREEGDSVDCAGVRDRYPGNKERRPRYDRDPSGPIKIGIIVCKSAAWRAMGPICHNISDPTSGGRHRVPCAASRPDVGLMVRDARRVCR